MIMDLLESDFNGGIIGSWQQLHFCAYNSPSTTISRITSRNGIDKLQVLNIIMISHVENRQS